MTEGNRRHTQLLGGQRWRLIAWSGAALLLLTPWIAMQFTTEVNWTPFDFLIFAAMLGVLGGGIELAIRLSRQRSYRAAAALALFGGFLLFWANGAVGVIGSENNPVNRLFDGLLVAGLLGAVVARFRARGLALTLLLMALGQFAIAVYTSLSGLGHAWVPTAFFGAIWLTAAGLFRDAAIAEPKP